MTGKKIRALREGLGLSRAQLAVASGIAGETIEKLETVEGREPAMATLRALAAALGTDPCELL